MNADLGGPLAGSDYVDPQVFSREAKLLFPALPVLVSPASTLSDPGSFVSFERGCDSILAINGPEGVRGFANHCLHRGFRLVDVPSGRAERFVCPYHGWCYGPDGRLLSARGLGRGVKLTRQLDSLPVFNLAGLHLLAPPAAHDLIGERFTECLSAFHLADAVVQARESFIARCNWKLWVENFLECWHCHPNHPQLSSIEGHIRQIEAGDYECYMAEQDSWRKRAARVGFPISAGIEIDPGELVFGFCETVALGGRRRSPTPDGRRIGPALANDGLDGGIVFGAIGPFLHFSIAVDHAVLFSFVPITCDQTRVDCQWLTRAGDIDHEPLTWLWKHTLEQDRKLTERLHRSVASGLYAGGCYLAAEQRAARFSQWWRRWGRGLSASSASDRQQGH